MSLVPKINGNKNCQKDTDPFWTVDGKQYQYFTNGAKTNIMCIYT